jgi:hypothetical protein
MTLLLQPPATMPGLFVEMGGPSNFLPGLALNYNPISAS